jgi:cardiolipin synthase
MDDVPVRDGLTSPQLDYAVRVQGVLVNEIQMAMQHLWRVVSWANFRRRGSHSILPAADQHKYGSNLNFLVRDNVRHRREIEQAYLRMIASAKHEVIIANAYFLPGQTFRHGLLQSAQRGVRVILLLQGQMEYAIQHFATRYLYDEFLEIGIEIYEYQTSYLHAKVAVVDGECATVGSSNIDPFSLLLAREANLLVNDRGFAESLRASLLVAIKNDAKRIEKTERKYFIRCVSRISYGIIRLLVGVLGISKWH